jgi:hypothetical protein
MRPARPVAGKCVANLGFGLHLRSILGEAEKMVCFRVKLPPETNALG